MEKINAVRKILSECAKIKSFYEEKQNFRVVRSGDGWLRLDDGTVIYETDADTYGSTAHGDTLDSIINDYDTSY